MNQRVSHRISQTQIRDQVSKKREGRLGIDIRRGGGPRVYICVAKEGSQRIKKGRYGKDMNPIGSSSTPMLHHGGSS